MQKFMEVCTMQSYNPDKQDHHPDSNHSANHGKEQTLIILKPDAVRRALTEELTSKTLERCDATIVMEKETTLTAQIVREHYAHIAHLAIFEEIISSMIEGPVKILVLTGFDVVARVRAVMGPLKEPPADTLRGMYLRASDPAYYNLMHASATIEEAKQEIERFFGDKTQQ
jgi:nucleoside-diphosphate kinase